MMIVFFLYSVRRLVINHVVILCRLKKGKEIRKEAARVEVEKTIHLIRPPAGTDAFCFLVPLLF